MRKILLLGTVTALTCCLVSTQEGQRQNYGGSSSLFLPSAAAGPMQKSEKTFVKNVDPEEAHKALEQHKEITILDVRTPEEFKEGHLAGATNLNYNAANFGDQLKELDKEKTYLVYCRSGRRSSRARDLMIKQGFYSLYHLEGGINSWIKADLPVRK